MHKEDKDTLQLLRPLPSSNKTSTGLRMREYHLPTHQLAVRRLDTLTPDCVCCMCKPCLQEESRATVRNTLSKRSLVRQEGQAKKQSSSVFATWCRAFRKAGLGKQHEEQLKICKRRHTAQTPCQEHRRVQETCMSCRCACSLFFWQLLLEDVQCWREPRSPRGKWKKGLRASRRNATHRRQEVTRAEVSGN